jgi:hypothetical protein
MGRRLTEFTDPVHLFLTLDPTKVDDPRFIHPLLHGTETIGRFVPIIDAHVLGVPCLSGCLRADGRCVSRVEGLGVYLPFVSGLYVSSQVHLARRYAHICGHLFDHCVSMPTKLGGDHRKLSLDVGLGCFVSLL